MWKPRWWRVGICVAAGLVSPGCDKQSPTEPPPGPCTYAVSPSSLAFAAAGGSSAVSVASPAHCTWTATADRNWMSIIGAASGTGNGAVTVRADPNQQETARSGTLNVAGQAVAVQEEGLGICIVELSADNAFHSQDAGSGEFTVRALEHCGWTATSSTNWLTVASGATGTGGGTVGYTIDRNVQTAPRAGTITVAGRTFTVNQAGDTPPPTVCDYSVAPVEFAPCMSASYQLTAQLSTSPGCTWTVTTDQPWISLASGQSGSGPAVISFTVSDNWDAPRRGIVMVRWPTVTAGQNLHVSQAGCFYAVSTTAITIAAAGGPGRFDVIQASDPVSCGGPTQSACPWTASADVPWITITTSMPQAGDNPVAFSVAANPSATSRTGRITVRDKVVQVLQNGR